VALVASPLALVTLHCWHVRMEVVRARPGSGLNRFGRDRDIVAIGDQGVGARTNVHACSGFGRTSTEG